MRQLKVQVERVVRPIRASVGRKMKMREELFAHLTARYQEGLANGLKEEAAVRQALERFGNPATLGAELQASVPAVERMLYFPFPLHGRIIKAGLCLPRRDDESVLHHALRTCLFFGFCIVCLDAFLFVFQTMALGRIQDVGLGKCALFLAAFHGVTLACSFPYLVFLDKIQDALQVTSTAAHRVVRIGGWCVLSSAVTLGAGMSIRLILGGHLNCSGFFWPLVAGCVLIPGMLVWQAVALAADRKRREEWENLILDN